MNKQFTILILITLKIFGSNLNTYLPSISFQK